MTSSLLEAQLNTELHELATASLSRQRRILRSHCGRLANVDGYDLLNFASNDYLGLANHPSLVKAMADGAMQWGAGSGASHLVSGHLAPHEMLERTIAQFTGFTRALSFSTGYLANLAVTPALAGRGAAVFADKLNHASLIDAMQLAKANGATVQRYPHNDIAALQRLLAKSHAKTKLIVTDAVFSMDGDIAPLAALLALADQYDTWLLIDDAHGFGVLGPQGRGTLAHLNLPPSPRILLMGTLGKAAGVGGAFVAGSETAIEYLLQRARSYIFTTAAPPAIACALIQSIEIIKQGQALRDRLTARISELQTGFQGLPWQLLSSPTAIQPVIVGDNTTALSLANALWAQGIWVPAIRPPTVPQGTARLRISLSAAHHPEDIEKLVASLKSLA